MRAELFQVRGVSPEISDLGCVGNETMHMLIEDLAIWQNDDGA
jgi:hypothetical protein